MADRFIDCKGMSCPMPIVEIAKAVRQMAVGQTVEVEAKDPSFKNDVQAWARRTGNEILSLETTGEVLRANIRRTK